MNESYVSPRSHWVLIHEGKKEEEAPYCYCLGLDWIIIQRVMEERFPRTVLKELSFSDCGRSSGETDAAKIHTHVRTLPDNNRILSIQNSTVLD